MTRRLAAIDWLLLGTTLPIFLIGLVMTVICGVRGDFVLTPFLATSAADGQSYPLVGRILSSPSPEANPLAVGDRLLRMEGNDLRGVSNLGFLLRWSQAAQAGARSLRLTIERDSVRSEVRVSLVPGYNFLEVDPFWWAPLPFIVCVAGTALLLLVRATHWHLARRNYVVSLLLAIFYMPYFTFPTAPRVEIICDVLVFPLAQGLLLWNLNEFLPSVRLWGPGQRAVAWALGLLQSAAMVAVFWLPDARLTAISAEGLVAFGFAIAFLMALTRVYRRADPAGRRRIKWVIYGFYVASLFFGLWAAAMGIAPEWMSVLATVAYIAQVAIPLGFLVAITFYQFLDIDRLFSATLSYSVLATLGLAVLLGVEPTASRTASDVLGLDPTIGQLLMALGLAAVLVPAYRIVRPWTDQWFFPERAALGQEFEQLLGQIPSLADVQELTQLVCERLDALLRPAFVVLYTRAGDRFTPLAARGRNALPAFATRSALIAALQERTMPLAAQRWTARRAASLTPFERAALETLDVAVLVPIRRGAELVAFWCLGPKRSGDIYTATDLALLGAVAGAISDRLIALGQAWSPRQPSAVPFGEEEPTPAMADTLGMRGAQTTSLERRPDRQGLHPWLMGGTPPGLLPQSPIDDQSGPEPRKGWHSRARDEAPGGFCDTSDAGRVMPAAAADEACVFHREGEYWTLAYRGKTARLRDTKGLTYIARLLAQPGCELHVRDLATMDAPGHGGNGSGAVCVEGDVGTLLDARATAQYKERLVEARQELEAATAAGDLGQTTRLQQEIETITEQLAAAYGLGGRARTAGDPAERARKAVTNQIRRALERIGAAHPELGHHLTNALRTGFLCTYRPEQSVAWRL